MKGRRLIFVGLLLSLVVTPIAWADDTATGQDEGSWSFGWLQDVANWIASIIEGPDPIPQGKSPLEIQDSEQVQSVPAEEDRNASIDPSGNR